MTPVTPLVERPLIDRLPPVRGRLTADAPLDRLTWLRVGGPAEVLFRPADMADLQAFLAARPADVPFTVLGVGSNVLVRDGGVPGVVIRLGAPFAAVRRTDDGIAAGGAALDLNVALAARDAGLGGLTFLAGIPGTIGAAVRMNAGAHGTEVKDVITGTEAVDPEGRQHRLAPADLGLGYRSSALPGDWIITGATFRGTPEAPDTIRRRMADEKAKREAAQPTGCATAGSTFANPPGQRAWELIEAAGCRGLAAGGAMISEKHANFIINTGGATAADVESLGETVRRRVLDTCGVALRWEVRRLGVERDAGGRP